MHATICRYEGVDVTRINEVVGQVNQTLVPKLRELPGFNGYYLIEGSSGVLSSLGLFETAEQADKSTVLVSKWITDEHFDTVIPNPPPGACGGAPFDESAAAHAGTRLTCDPAVAEATVGDGPRCRRDRVAGDGDLPPAR